MEGRYCGVRLNLDDFISDTLTLLGSGQSSAFVTAVYHLLRGITLMTD